MRFLFILFCLVLLTYIQHATGQPTPSEEELLLLEEEYCAEEGGCVNEEWEEAEVLVDEDLQWEAMAHAH